MQQGWGGGGVTSPRCFFYLVVGLKLHILYEREGAGVFAFAVDDPVGAKQMYALCVSHHIDGRDDDVAAIESDVGMLERNLGRAARDNVPQVGAMAAYSCPKIK